MSRRETKARVAAADVERQADRLLRALAEPGVSAKATDIPRPGQLVVSGKRRGVSLVTAHFCAAAGSHLVAHDLARWSEAGGRPVLEITETGPRKAPAQRSAGAAAIPGAAS